MKISILHELVLNIWEKEEFSTKQVKFGTNTYFIKTILYY